MRLYAIIVKLNVIHTASELFWESNVVKFVQNYVQHLEYTFQQKCTHTSCAFTLRVVDGIYYPNTSLVNSFSPAINGRHITPMPVVKHICCLAKRSSSAYIASCHTYMHQATILFIQASLAMLGGSCIWSTEYTNTYTHTHQPTDGLTITYIHYGDNEVVRHVWKTMVLHGVSQQS